MLCTSKIFNKLVIIRLHHLKVLDITITTGIPETEKENNVPGINIHNFFFDK
jgi:hypothetical protein